MQLKKNISFLSKRNSFSIGSFKACIDKYRKYFDKVKELDAGLPIFLDTNVLLRYYSISFTARKKLFDFVEDNLKYIILTEQVQYEFIKNREDVIQRFFEQVTSKIPKDFNTDVVNKMNNFIEVHKVVLKDYLFVETGIKKHQSELEDLLNKLNETAERKKRENNGLIMNDPFIDLLNKCSINNILDDAEKQTFKVEYDTLCKNISLDNIESIINKHSLVFPGLGDFRSKPDDPYGDYIIYHEILKYAINNKTDCIFLTFDNSKGDWMTKSKTPLLHYIQNFYENSSQIIYILDAERILGKLLNIEIDSLVKTESSFTVNQPITIAGLILLFSKNEMFNNIPSAKITENHVTELKVNGYNNLEQVNFDLNRGKEAIKAFQANEGVLTTIGVLRVCLKIVNPNYTKEVDEFGEIQELSDFAISFFERYRKYVLKY